ncbi:hypothetical protein [Flavonifractor sp. An9]|uniref:hypothetical protein n=1 Tax=Flavonifractor sp. An9 TaxID=1965664 RepID=UPI000B38829F|nr:hypothetical protein [Flavonifractor sp. An9]OUN09911.1 hypothetical protein B5G40_11300 [Flavonifractor sp. An9]
MGEAIIGLAGVIIGALIGVVTTHMQNKNSVNLFLLEKRVQTYLPIIEKYLKSTRDTDINSTRDAMDEFQLLTPELLLYGSDEVKKQTERVKNLVLLSRLNIADKKMLDKDTVLKELQEFAALIEIMRSELKIH